MAVVSEMITPGGVRVIVCDDLYRDASEEEIRRRRAAFYKEAAKMVAGRQARERQQSGELNKPKCAERSIRARGHYGEFAPVTP